MICLPYPPLLSKISQIRVKLLSSSVQNLSALLMLAVSKLLACGITNFLQAVATIDFHLWLLHVSELVALAAVLCCPMLVVLRSFIVDFTLLFSGYGADVIFLQC
ncbi:hypothetical protein OIU76_005615 [Salix suchowensis]|nr:hypothetical protein OIU76_005615 [Salix suchowensis]